MRSTPGTPRPSGQDSVRTQWKPSVRLLGAQQPDCRQREDLDVEDRRPVPEVFEVILDARAHVLYAHGLAAEAVDLRKPGDSRRDFVAHHVALDELAVLLVVSDGVRTRTDEAHAPLQHVEELRELIERVPPQEAAERCDARIVLARLHDTRAILGDGHGAEFVDEDLLAIEPVAALLEDDGPAR